MSKLKDYFTWQITALPYIVKIKYLQEHSFGGAFVWALDLDDFSGYFCGQGNYPLVNNLKKLLILGEICLNTLLCLFWMVIYDKDLKYIYLFTTGAKDELCASMATNTSTSNNTFATVGKGSSPPTCVKTLSSLPALGSQFCANRSDGLYHRMDSLNSFYSCTGGMTSITWCTPAVLNNSEAAQPSQMILLITLGSACLLVWHCLLI